MWKIIENYPMYRVNENGEIMFIGDKYHKQHIMKQHIASNGYNMLTLRDKDGKKHHVLVHRLVAKAFIPNPDNLPQVGHLDEDRQNNRADNLCWCTAKQNNNYGDHNKRVSEATMNKKGKKVRQYSLEGEFIKEYPSTREVQRQTGFFSSNIVNACNLPDRTAYNYKWKYAN